MNRQQVDGDKNTILLTGGCGYIGSHTAVTLMAEGYDVVIVDDLSNSHASVLDAIEQISGRRPAFYQVDCADQKALDGVFEKHSRELRGAIHFAAYKAVGESVEYPLRYYDNNINSLLSLVRCMMRHGVRDLVFSSSCTVYGQPSIEHLPITESAPRMDATSPYGNTKRINEDIITDTVRSGLPLDAVILRYFNPIGAHPSALIGEEPNGTPQNLVPYLTQTVAGLRKELTVFGNDYNTPDGTCIRDYIDVMDLAAAHVAALRRLDRGSADESPAYHIYNVGVGRGVSVLELIKGFEEATGLPVPHRIGPRRSGDIEQIWADPTYGEQELQWRAQIPLAESLRRAWQWQLHCLQRDGIKA